MRVSANGYYRDHGSKTLVEEELADVAIENYVYIPCYVDKTIIHTRTNELGDSYISIITRVNATMQGNYRLEIRLTLSDILTLFWIGFKDKALQVVFQDKTSPTPSGTSTA
jgi:hypothetical protein